MTDWWNSGATPFNGFNILARPSPRVGAESSRLSSTTERRSQRVNDMSDLFLSYVGKGEWNKAVHK